MLVMAFRVRLMRSPCVPLGPLVPEDRLRLSPVTTSGDMCGPGGHTGHHVDVARTEAHGDCLSLKVFEPFLGHAS